MSELNHEFCCNIMDYYVDPTFSKEHELISYDLETRSYSFILHGYNKGAYQTINYCPWCGTKVPERLSEEWCKVIKEKFGLDNVFAEEWAALPEEFKTDEWWKKRGL